MTKTLRTVWKSDNGRPSELSGTCGRQHAVELGDLELGVADQRIVGRETLRFLDVARPAGVALHRIDRQADDLDAAPVELRLDLGEVAELGGADRREVLGMREQDRPFVADPLVEPDAALGGFGLEVGGQAANAEQGSLHRSGSEPHDAPSAATAIGGCMDSSWRKPGFCALTPALHGGLACCPGRATHEK